MLIMTSALGEVGAWIKEMMGIKEMLSFRDWRYPTVSTPF